MMDAQNRLLNLTKIVELLSTCTRIQDTVGLALVKHHERRGVACGKYFYEVRIVLKKTEEGGVPRFDFRRAYFNFLYDSDLENRTISGILENLNNSVDIKSADHDDIYRNSFLALVRRYTNSTYRYMYVSVIIDYGNFSGLVHQTAIVVDLQKGQFLFYEPYGEYTKYGASYKDAVRRFLLGYEFPAKYYEGTSRDTIKYSTWHDYFGLPTGIQTILMRAHNQQQRSYEQDKATFMNRLKEVSGRHHDALVARIDQQKDHPAHKDDFTFDTLEIAAYFSRDYDESGHSSDIELAAMDLYFKYNSKTCVTITITEMDYFFANLADVPLDGQQRALAAYYSEFATHDNQKLMERLDEFFRDAMNHEAIHDWAQRYSIRQMCDTL
jgi:hypothetical protein